MNPDLEYEDSLGGGWVREDGDVVDDAVRDIFLESPSNDLFGIAVGSVTITFLDGSSVTYRERV